MSPHSTSLCALVVALALWAWHPMPAAGQAPAVIQVQGATHVDVDEGAGVWRLRGDPVTISRGPLTVRAPEIRYDSRLQVVHASGGVTYDDGMSSLRSRTVTVWLREDRAAAAGAVEAAYRDDEAVTRIRAEQINVWSGERRAAATGGVLLSRADLVLSGESVEYIHPDRHGLVVGAAKLTTSDGTLTADRIDARLGQDEFTADGTVRFVRPDLDARAARLVYRRRDAVAVLTGDAVVRTGRGEVSGQTMTVELNRRRFQASGQVHLVLAAER